jgi:hypothetical protein
VILHPASRKCDRSDDLLAATATKTLSRLHACATGIAVHDLLPKLFSETVSRTNSVQQMVRIPDAIVPLQNAV